MLKYFLNKTFENNIFTGKTFCSTNYPNITITRRPFINIDKIRKVPNLNKYFSDFSKVFTNFYCNTNLISSLPQSNYRIVKNSPIFNFYYNQSNNNKQLCFHRSSTNILLDSLKFSFTFSKLPTNGEFCLLKSSVKQFFNLPSHSFSSLSITKPHFLKSKTSYNRFFSTTSEQNINENTISNYQKIRNIAIIAHVDHGKTTLVDSLLKTSGLQITHQRQLDSNDIEKERGITILSKVIRLLYNGYILHIVDTPGHADFGGEVERVLSMVDGVCLVVDAVEGPKTQTKFVLKKALQNASCKPIVIINKVDRQNIRKYGDCENEIFDLFLNLNANDEQMEYPTLYASGRNGWVENNYIDINNVNHINGMKPLLDTIINYINPPSIQNTFLYFKYLVTLLEYQQNIGVITTGKIYSGNIYKGDIVYVLTQDGKVRGQTTIKGLYIQDGLKRREINEASEGEIVSISYWKGINPFVGETISTNLNAKSVRTPKLDPPVISVVISANTSPLVAKDGQHIALNTIGKRLNKEASTNIAISVEESPNKTSFEVKGRGELQIAILLETLRREGYEMSVSSPSVVFKYNEDGKPLEPWEEIEIEIPNEISASVIDKLNFKNAEIVDMQSKDEKLILKVYCSSRNFIGMRSYLKDISKSEILISSEIFEFRPISKEIKLNRNKLIISSTSGITSAFALESLQSKGTLFVSEGVPTYEGMILGETNSSTDIEMNAVKTKHLTNMRTKGHEETVKLNIKQMNIEHCLSYILSDELIEITPKRVCMRKKLLSYDERKAAAKKCK